MSQEVERVFNFGARGIGAVPAVSVMRHAIESTLPTDRGVNSTALCEVGKP